MKKIYWYGIAFFTLVCLGISAQFQKKQKIIAFIQTIEHPALDETRKGFEEEMKKRFPECQYVFESAQGNPTLAAQIAQKHANASVMVTVGTLPSQMAMNVSKTTPIIFGSVTDPSLLVKNFKAPEGNITGVSNYVDTRRQLLYFKSLQPHLKKVGVIFNPSEANSIKEMKFLRKIAKEMGLVLFEMTALKASEVGSAAQNLVGKIDAFFVIDDNTSLSAYSAIVRAAGAVPIYTTDVDCLKKGGRAALGANQFLLGKQVAAMVAKVLKGVPLKKIPVEWPHSVIQKCNP